MKILWEDCARIYHRCLVTLRIHNSRRSVNLHLFYEHTHVSFKIWIYDTCNATQPVIYWGVFFEFCFIKSTSKTAMEYCIVRTARFVTIKDIRLRDGCPTWKVDDTGIMIIIFAAIQQASASGPNFAILWLSRLHEYFLLSKCDW